MLELPEELNAVKYTVINPVPYDTPDKINVMLGYNKTLFASTANSILVVPEEAVKSFSATISSLLERAAIFSGKELANTFPEKINEIESFDLSSFNKITK